MHAVYLDNHASTRVDPRVLEVMLPYFDRWYANAGSVTHEAGREVKQLVESAHAELAQMMGADPSELVITSGATESNNLALFGVCLHPRQKRRRVVSMATEHRALLDPLARLESHGFEIVRLGVQQVGEDVPGQIRLDELAAAVNDDTCLVSVMLANNEIGVIQPLAAIARIAHEHGAFVHTDATQAVGRLPVFVDTLETDLLSLSAHKFYGPKGVGALYVRNRERRVRLQATIVGGGQQSNLRSGTLNSAGIVGMATALQLCMDSAATERPRIRDLRNRLANGIKDSVSVMRVNGPAIEDEQVRLAGNLNCELPGVEGQAIMSEIPGLAMSSGSACTSAEPRPSHVLQAIGLSEEQARCSLRLGVGRFNTEAEIDLAIEWIGQAYDRLRKRFQ